MHNTVLLTMVLCCTDLWNSFVSRNLTFIPVERLSIFPSPSPQATTILFCFHDFDYFILFFFDFDYFRYLIYVESSRIYPSGTDISLSVASPVHPFCCKRQGIFFFSVIKLNNIPLSVHTTVSLLICQWKFGLCEYCCNEYERALMSLRSWLQFFWICTQKWD